METDQNQRPVDNPSRLMNHRDAREDKAQLTVCDYCKRPVKVANLSRHLEVCLKAPKYCVYCGEYFPKEDVANHRDAREGEVQLTACDYCKRPVKEANLSRHLEVCPKAPKDCVYCGEYFPKEDWMGHFKECRENPCNVPQNTNAAGAGTTKASRRLADTERSEVQGLKGATRGLQHGNIPLPELPTLDLSEQDMKTWHNALLQCLTNLGVSDNHQRYQLLWSAITPEVQCQLPEIPTSLPRDRAFERLLKNIFELRKNARQSGSDSYFANLLRDIRDIFKRVQLKD